MKPFHFIIINQSLRQLTNIIILLVFQVFFQSWVSLQKQLTIFPMICCPRNHFCVARENFMLHINQVSKVFRSEVGNTSIVIDWPDLNVFGSIAVKFWRNEVNIRRKEKCVLRDFFCWNNEAIFIHTLKLFSCAAAYFSVL